MTIYKAQNTHVSFYTRAVPGTRGPWWTCDLGVWTV